MERIYVSVRPRPVSLEDAKTSPWRISGNSISISTQVTKFEFDRVFREDCKTAEVYGARTKDLVSAAVRGFNGTVFAYGQTNSGKTHTMRGSSTEPGVIPLAVHDLFRTIQEDGDREFLLRMSYMEIYNEEINDLLAPEHRKLQIHESLERGIFVAGLREEIVASPEQVLDLMEFGESHRHFGETNMNVYSSRSHTIFRMIIESRDRTEDGDAGSSCDAVRVSVLSLVDLAGSERAAKTGAEGMRLKEGSHINKSLMTLGTVIKKLSEGAENQGGHVPYRDSKLTRILQPSLGGNANTAIICNITLAQIHTDETKSSLQFASRALRVTNCARVNEILTDAALLKRQKKEIEELRAKLQGSHSEHFEKEILNLRNTLLKSELERERITLELQEEKKAKELRDRRLKEQDKKIQNLSSMVLNSNLDDKPSTYKKDKRRDTWCPGAILREAAKQKMTCTTLSEVCEESVRPERDTGLNLPFEELVTEHELRRDDIPLSKCLLDKNANIDLPEDCSFPDANALLHVTSRRKAPVKKMSSLVENAEVVELQAEYEDLLIKFETQRIIKDIEIECLTQKVVEQLNFYPLTCQLTEQLQKQLHQEPLNGGKKADVAHEQLSTGTSLRTTEEESGYTITEMLGEVQQIMLADQNSRDAVESICSVVDELLGSFSAVSDLFLDLKSFTRMHSTQLSSIICDHDKMHRCTNKKVFELESDKISLYNQSIDLHKQIQELSLSLQESERDLMERCQQQELEKAEFVTQIEALEKEISYLSSSSLVKEKETLRKELEKTKVKLKETEAKLKNAIQDKTRLEGEKAQSEREIKRLHSQKNILERDISKRESIAGRRRESFVDRRRDSFLDRRQEAKPFDFNKAQAIDSPLSHSMQGEHRKLEVLAFEMETTIASLEEDLAAANAEKQEAIEKCEILASEMEAMSIRLSTTSSELEVLRGEVTSMNNRFTESELFRQEMESTVSLLLGEKEELATQLTEALLELEEEKVIWSAKEKATIEAMTCKSRSSNVELELLSKEMLQVSHELQTFREECKVLKERLAISEERAEWEKESRMEKIGEIDQLKIDIMNSKSKSEKCLHALKHELLIITEERDQLLIHKEEQQKLMIQFGSLKEHYSDMLSRSKVDIEELTRRISIMETKMHKDALTYNKEQTKLRMRLRGTQASLDAHRGRYKEALDEMDFMNKKFEEASKKLKGKLAESGVEILNLKKQLAGV